MRATSEPGQEPNSSRTRPSYSWSARPAWPHQANTGSAGAPISPEFCRYGQMGREPAVPGLAAPGSRGERHVARHVGDTSRTRPTWCLGGEGGPQKLGSTGRRFLRCGPEWREHSSSESGTLMTVARKRSIDGFPPNCYSSPPHIFRLLVFSPPNPPPPPPPPGVARVLMLSLFSSRLAWLNHPGRIRKTVS